MPRLWVEELGLSSAFASDLLSTLDVQADRRAAYREMDGFFNLAFDPQVCAFKEPNTLSTFIVRAEELLRDAVTDLMKRIAERDQQKNYFEVELAFLLPETVEGYLEYSNDLDAWAHRNAQFINRQVAQELGWNLTSFRVIAQGASGFGRLCHHLLNEEPVFFSRPTLFVAVDTYNDRARLNYLNEAGMLFSNRNQYGFIPGEAGVAGLLVRGLDETGGQHSRCEICSVGIGREEVLEQDEAETQFRGLSEACFQATDELPEGARIEHWYSDWNNSRYRATELAFAIHRVGRERLVAHLEPIYTTLTYGDCGAVNSLLAIVHHVFDARETGSLRSIVTSGDYSTGVRTAIMAG